MGILVWGEKKGTLLPFFLLLPFLIVKTVKAASAVY